MIKVRISKCVLLNNALAVIIKGSTRNIVGIEIDWCSMLKSGNLIKNRML